MEFTFCFNDFRYSQIELHDFNNVQQYTKENDAEHGFTDLHTIRPKIQPVIDDSKEILGYMHEQFQNFHFNF